MQRWRHSQSTRFTLTLSVLVGFGLVALSPEAVWAGKDRFSVLGWVKNKVSPAQKTRTAQPRPRPMPAPTMESMASSSVGYPQGAPPIPSRPPITPVAINQGAMPPPAMPAVAPAPRIGNAPPRGNGPATIAELRRRAEYLSTRGLTYKFGGDHPNEGGMDCSGTMQFMLKSMGFSDIPRTSYAQYEWLQQKGTLRKVGFFRNADRAIRDFRPGDLIFWGGTYNSGHRVSHVMVYLGRNKSGTHYVFGARGKKVKGLNGNGVDIFEFKPQSTGGRLVGYGPLPGIR